jgi:hypothetical protein
MPEGLVDLIINVITSWQVIVVTIVFFLYWSIVSAASNPRKSKSKKAQKPNKLKRPKEIPVNDAEKEAETGGLGLGE